MKQAEPNFLRHWTPNQVAEYFSVDVSTVWRWISKGKLGPYRKTGHRTVRIPGCQVKAFEDGCTVTP
jgi:excisionase family DNA binding protein